MGKSRGSLEESRKIHEKLLMVALSQLIFLIFYDLLYQTNLFLLFYVNLICKIGSCFDLDYTLVHKLLLQDILAIEITMPL